MNHPARQNHRIIPVTINNSDCLKSYSVEPLDQEACFTSAYSDEPDFEDGCIRAMAERAGVDFIITRDRAAFVRSTIKTFSPAEFIRAFPIPEE